MGIAKELFVLGAAYLRHNYPSFVYSDKADPVPAFYYHDLPAEEFESHLRYLQDNGYRTLHCGQAVERLKGFGESRRREAMLTFDDGLSGFRDVIFPLLKKYEIKAVSYLVPGWIGKPGFVAWDDCRRMRDSGLVDFQSHSYSHSKIVTSLRIESVWRLSSSKPIPWGLPGFNQAEFGKEIKALPVFTGDPLFKGTPGYSLPGTFWKDCSHLAELGGDDLAAGFSRILSKSADLAVRIQGDGLLSLMEEDLKRSRDSIERELPGQRAAHFAFPWHENSPLAWKALARLGFDSAAVGIRGTDRGEAAGVTKIFRVSGDFIPCLPGKGKKSFLNVVSGKLARRFRKTNVYGIAN